MMTINFIPFKYKEFRQTWKKLEFPINFYAEYSLGILH